jgi:hypothetical protein
MKKKGLILTLGVSLLLFISGKAQNLIGTYSNNITSPWTHVFNVVQGNQYRMVVSGQFSFGSVCPNFEMDPAYWIPPYNGGNSLTHGCNDAWYIQGYCNGNLGIRPTPDVYNPLHEYDYYITANSNTITVGLTDCCFGDNCGSITFTLYDVVQCSNNLTITPANNAVNSGSTITFSATTTDPNPNYVWQSDLGQGFQTLNNYGKYSGANTGTLTITNVQLPNHTQQIRAISTSGTCVDTSNIATISITDTCINTINDTNFITVTDTLLINALITSVSPSTNNLIKVFPNPSISHLYIDNGNYQQMSGYAIRIDNSLGQQVFQSAINQQQFYVDLSTWSGNGLYFLYLINPQGQIIDVRKIILQ